MYIEHNISILIPATWLGWRMEINVSLEEELIVVKRLNELNVQAQEQVEMMEHFQYPNDWGGNGGTFSIPSVRLWQCPDPPCNWCLIVVILSREIKGSTWYPPIPGWVPRQPGRFYQHINMKISTATIWSLQLTLWSLFVRLQSIMLLMYNLCDNK